MNYEFWFKFGGSLTGAIAIGLAIGSLIPLPLPITGALIGVAVICLLIWMGGQFNEH